MTAVCDLRQVRNGTLGGSRQDSQRKCGGGKAKEFRELQKQ
jgi:hypothetical protein